MPNTFSFIALFLLFPILAIGIFHRLSLQKAVILVFLLGFFFLPERAGLDLTLFPPLNKFTIPALCVLVLTWTRVGSSQRKIEKASLAENSYDGNSARQVAIQDRGIGIFSILLAAYLISPFFTMAFNRDPVIVGPYFLRGMDWKDGFNGLTGALAACIPFLVARRFLADKTGLETLLRLIAIFGFIYSWLVLFEVRMSPQLHTWVYGFFPHQFAQQIRQDGFRAVVFTEHGLKVAIFLACAALASAAMYRSTSGSSRTKWLWLTIWLLFVLVLQKSLGALLIVLPLVALTLLSANRLRLLILFAIAMILITYPAARVSSLFKQEQILRLITTIDSERVGSLQFRFQNEEILLAKAMARPVFGWGGWSRNRVFNEAGRDVSITDGYWIIRLGTAGWFGYIALFGLWTLPVIALWRMRARPEEQLAAPAAVAGLLTLLLVDLVPNSGLPHLTWLIAGALVGWIESNQRENSPVRRSVKHLGATVP